MFTKLIWLTIKMKKFPIPVFLKKLITNFFLFFNYEIRKIGSDKKLPIETTKIVKDFINISKQYSMTGTKRMYLLSQVVENIKSKNIEGDFIECGVWKGGNILLLKLFNNYYNLNKKIYAFDTFVGMTKPENLDVDLRGEKAFDQLQRNKKIDGIKNIHAYCSLEDVKNNIKKYTDLENIKFIEGPVEKTLKTSANLPDKISILRLDTDWYSSTKIELEILYPRLAKGGVLIIDDYGHWEGSRKAVNEYFGNNVWLHLVDYSCRYIIKE